MDSANIQYSDYLAPDPCVLLTVYSWQKKCTNFSQITELARTTFTTQIAI